MLQVVQYQKDGRMEIAEVPRAACPEGGVLVRVHFSLISAGTEKTSVTNTQSSLLGRARKQPEQVKQVISMVKKEGLATTVSKVLSKLDSYKSLGYSVSGEVVESDTPDFNVGDRVAAAGAGYANHAEFVGVPKNLVCKLPDNVSFEDAAYTTLGAIAMQGFRQAEPVLGESVVVIGLGLLGQITVQLLKAAGCRVVGMDINESLFEKAKCFGADLVLPSSFSSVEAVKSFTRGFGADSVIITASSSSNEPMELALELARKKGKVVVVGAVSMNIPRGPFYLKEIDLRISCSYGPGRYDSSYEEHGQDYPLPYVRWTENRNMIAFIDMISMGKMNVKDMTSHSFDIKDAIDAYDIITGKKQERHLGILLRYPLRSGDDKVSISLKSFEKKSKIAIGFIGAGNFATNNLLPPLKSLGVDLVAVSTSTPVNAKTSADKFGFSIATTDSSSIIENKDVNTIFIASRHFSHFEYVRKALEAGKAVFVEKPLAVDFEQLDSLASILRKHNVPLMVGFNRRFSAPFISLKKFFAGRSDAMVMNYRVNAGFVPKSHWLHEEKEGGRIIGEVCHFIDCMMFLTESRPVSVFAQAVSSVSTAVQNPDNSLITVKFSDGSIGTVAYLANGDGSLPKEYLEVFCERKSAVMNNFTTLELYKGSRQVMKFNGKKGISEEVKLFVDALKNGSQMPISPSSLFDATAATFAAVESLKTGVPIELSSYVF